MSVKNIAIYGAATLLIVIAISYIVKRSSNVVTPGA